MELNSDLPEILESIDKFSPQERTDLLCGIIDHCCLDPHQLYPLLGIDEKIVDELANCQREYFESEHFHRKCLDCIPVETVRKYVNKFCIDNQ